MAADPTDLPVHALSESLAAGRLSPVDLVAGYLERIRRLDPKIHAFVAVYEAEARAAAEAAERAIRAGGRIGPWHGIPIALKDLIEIAGRVTTAGSEVWKDRVSTVTATLVRRLTEAGAIVLGKTHTVEFALGGWGTNQRRGTPWNPWDPRVHRCPGGSSSGSGAAVAARLAPCALGTDTGGSIRLPASFCGIVGLKVTIGRISVHGVLPLAETFDSPGPMTRSVEDAALLFNFLQGPDPLDPRTRWHPPDDPRPELKRGVAGLRLAVLPAAERAGVEADVLAAYDAAAEVLARAGARLVAAPLPRPIAAYSRLCGELMPIEGYSHRAGLVDRDDLPLDGDVRSRFLQARGRTAQDYLRLVHEREDAKREFDAAFAEIDALLTPTTPMTAVPIDAIDQQASPGRFTRMVNSLDRCALAVPSGAARDGLPTSLQIVARGYGEATALRIGWAFEQATGWHLRRPPGI
jgi:aspartyl-tRNA(Asn)/glutamyl-tRNA(Gln) amidotransferase subunit A